jgi:hypothetical protein
MVDTLFYASFTFSAPLSSPDDSEGKPEEPVNTTAHEASSAIDDSDEEGMSRSLIFFFFFDWNLRYFDFRLGYF